MRVSTKIKVLLLTLFYSSFSVSLFADEFPDRIIIGKDLLIQGINKLDEASMTKGIVHFEMLLKNREKEWLIEFYLGYAKFRLGNFFSTIKKDKNLSVRYFDDAIIHLEKSKLLNPNFVDSHTILSATYGSKIRVIPGKAVFLGGRAEDELKVALEMEPSNPRAWLHRGIGEFFTPRLFGGGKKTALKSLQKALELYKEEQRLDPEDLQWGEDEAHIWVGIVYKDWQQFKKAKVSYDAALEVNPQNLWLSDFLIPELTRALTRP